MPQTAPSRSPQTGPGRRSRGVRSASFGPSAARSDGNAAASGFGRFGRLGHFCGFGRLNLLARLAAPVLALCGGLAYGLHRIAGTDPLTAYLATSPGGADSVAIIAASSKVDVPFVMAMQTARFLLVLAIGPSLARAIARRIERHQEKKINLTQRTHRTAEDSEV